MYSIKNECLTVIHNLLLTGEPICKVENCGTIPYGTAVAESLLIIIETPRGCTESCL